jgi:hypothetical protein
MEGRITTPPTVSGVQKPEVYGFALLGLDMTSNLPCLARFCTPGVVGGVVVLPFMSHLV